jgi:hypothetical protein
MERTPFFKKYCVTNVTDSTQVSTNLLTNTNSAYDRLRFYKSADGSKHKVTKDSVMLGHDVASLAKRLMVFRKQLDGFEFMDPWTLKKKSLCSFYRRGTAFPGDTASHPRGKVSSAWLLWKPTGWHNWPAFPNSHIIVITWPLQEATHFNVIQGYSLAN